MAKFTLEAWVGVVAETELTQIVNGGPDANLANKVKAHTETLLRELSASESIDIVAKIGELTGSNASKIADGLLKTATDLLLIIGAAGGTARDDLVKARDQLRQMTDDRDRFESGLNDATKSITQLKSKITTLEAQASSGVQSQAQIDEIANLKKERDEKEKAYNKLSADFNELGTENRTYRDKIAELQADLDKCKQESGRLTSDNAALTTTVTFLRSRASAKDILDAANAADAVRIAAEKEIERLAGVARAQRLADEAKAQKDKEAADLARSQREKADADEKLRKETAEKEQAQRDKDAADAQLRADEAALKRATDAAQAAAADAADKKRLADEAARQAEAEKLAAIAAKGSKATHDEEQKELETLAGMVVFDNVSASAGKNQRVAKASKEPFALAYLSELRKATPLETYIAGEISSNKEAETHKDQFFQPLAIVGVWKTSDAFNKAVTDAGLSATNMTLTYSTMKELLEHFKEEEVVIENATYEINLLRSLVIDADSSLESRLIKRTKEFPGNTPLPFVKDKFQSNKRFRAAMYAFMKLMTPISESGSLALGLYTPGYTFVAEDPKTPSLMQVVPVANLQAFWAAKDASIAAWGDTEIPANTIPVANTLAESKTSHSGYAVAANADIAAPLSPGNRWAANPSIQAFLGDEGESSDSDDDDNPPVSLSHPIAAGVRSFFGMS